MTTCEFRMLEGRWADAFEIARQGWDETEVASSALALSLFASAAAADVDRLREAVEAVDLRLTDPQPMSVATRQIGTTFQALLDGRWDDGRYAYAAASRTLEATRNLQVLTQLRLAVGHLAGDRFPEAAEGLREAGSYFAERGAGGVVPAYRAAATSSPAGAPTRPRATSEIGQRDATAS